MIKFDVTNNYSEEGVPLLVKINPKSDYVPFWSIVNNFEFTNYIKYYKDNQNNSDEFSKNFIDKLDMNNIFHLILFSKLVSKKTSATPKLDSIFIKETTRGLIKNINGWLDTPVKQQLHTPLMRRYYGSHSYYELFYQVEKCVSPKLISLRTKNYIANAWYLTDSSDNTPIFTLMVKKEAVKYVRLCLLLGETPVSDCFEFWINESLDIKDSKWPQFRTQYRKYLKPKIQKEYQIPIFEKTEDELWSEFIYLTEPKFKSIKERKEWLNSVTKEYLASKKVQTVVDKEVIDKAFENLVVRGEYITTNTDYVAGIDPVQNLNPTREDIEDAITEAMRVLDTTRWNIQPLASEPQIFTSTPVTWTPRFNDSSEVISHPTGVDEDLSELMALADNFDEEGYEDLAEDESILSDEEFEEVYEENEEDENELP
jgi:hypothetical protein